MSEETKYKERPLRVFYDSKNKIFYVLSGGKKVPLKLPSKVNKLIDAQNIVNKKTKSIVTLPPPVQYVRPLRYYSEPYRSEYRYNRNPTIHPPVAGVKEVNYSKPVEPFPIPAKEAYRRYIENDTKFGAVKLDDFALTGKEAYEKEQEEKKTRSEEAKRRAAEEKQLTEIISKGQDQIDELKNLQSEIAATKNQLVLIGSSSSNERKALESNLKNLVAESQRIKDEVADSKKELQDLNKKQITMGELMGVLNGPLQAFTDSYKNNNTGNNNNNNNDNKSDDGDAKKLTYSDNGLVKESAGDYTRPLQFNNTIIDQSMMPDFSLTDDKKPPNRGMENKGIRHLKMQDRFKKDYWKFGLKFDDLEQYDVWNTEYGTVKDEYPIIMFIDELLNMKVSELIAKYADKFPGTDANSHPMDIVRNVLRHLTPLQLNEFSRQGLTKVPITSDPPRLGYGKDILPALYDDQIEEFFKNEPKFGGVISSDEVGKLPDRLPMGFIMNLDARDMPGSHWVACYMTGDSIEYFDPLADPPSEQFKQDIIKKIKSMKVPVMLKLKINKITQQHGSSHKCGYHCLRFLDDRFNDLDFPLASRFTDKKINNSKEGEGIIKDEFKLV